MRLLLPMLLLFHAGPSLAQEDAEHRADRLRTEQLNRHAQDAVNKREETNRTKLDRYARARAAYQREMDEWRQRSAACMAGDYAACDRR